MKKAFVSFIFLTTLCSAYAQESVPYAWITGEWVGDGFGGCQKRCGPYLRMMVP